MNPLRLYSLLACLLLTAAMGCDEGGHDHGPNGHSHDHGGSKHSHDHHEDDAAEEVTLWGAQTQLFVEFPSLVVGQESAFAVHLTRLSDHSALASGRVIVELSGASQQPDQPVETFMADEPTQAGIFRPVVTPLRPGPRQITVRFESEDVTEVHELGQFIVFGTPEGARTAAKSRAAMEEEGHHEEEIAFYLEQQWRVAFGVERVQVRPMRPALSVFGRLVFPPQAQTVIVAPRDGRVSAASSGGRFPMLGDAVEAGAALLTLELGGSGEADPALLNLAVERAEVHVEAARRVVERLEPLVEAGAVARRRLDEATSALDEAEAELRAAVRRRASFGQSQRVGRPGQETLRIPSPLTGTIAELLVASGSWVVQGQPIARVVDSRSLWLEAAVPEHDVGHLKDISGAWFKVPGQDDVVDLDRDALVGVGAQLDARTRTLPVRFRIENLAGLGLFAGLSPDVHLVIAPPRSSTAIPASSIVDDGGMKVVYVQLGGETFARRPVRLGIRDGAYVEVLDGIEAGEWVVGRGAYFIKLAAVSSDEIGHGHAH